MRCVQPRADAPAHPATCAARRRQTNSRRDLQRCEVQKVAPDGLVISYAPADGGVGIAKLKFTDLSDDLQPRYGYNPTNAAAFERSEIERRPVADAIARGRRAGPVKTAGG